MAGKLILGIGDFTKIIVVSLLFVAIEKEFLSFEGHIAVAQHYPLAGYSCFSISFIRYILAVHLQSVALLQHYVAVSDYLVFFLIEHCQITPHVQSLMAELHSLSIRFKNSCARVFYIINSKFTPIDNFYTFSFRLIVLCYNVLYSTNKN